MEEACDIQILGTGFPAEMTDDEPEEPGYEVKPQQEVSVNVQKYPNHVIERIAQQAYRMV